MSPTDISSPSASSSSANRSQRVSAVRMPIDEPIDDLDDAVAQLRECSSTELRRARKHHRRALTALQNGGYRCLPDATRDRLAARLQTHLDALNRALTPMDASDAPAEPADDTAALWSRVRAFFRGLW